MTTEKAGSMQNIAYRYKFLILVAIVFTCLSRLVLQGTGGENETYRYLIPLMAGGLTGYLIDSLLYNWQQSLYLNRNFNNKLKKTYQEQRFHETRHVNLFENNQSICILINATTGFIIEANPSACLFYGYSIEQFKQMHISLIDTLSREEIDYEIDKVKSNGRQTLLSRHKLASGEERDVELFSGPIVIDGTSCIFLVVSDMSEQKLFRGIIPICAHCKQVRESEGDWIRIEEYIQRHSEVRFSHGLCQSCAHQHYPTVYELPKN